MAMVSEFYIRIADESGEGSLELFKQHLSDPCLVEFSESIDIDPSEMEFFFELISSNGTRAVDLETFVVGSIKLVGMARSMDMVDAVITTKKLATDFVEFSEFVQKQFHHQQKSDRLMHELVSAMQRQLHHQAQFRSTERIV